MWRGKGGGARLGYQIQRYRLLCIKKEATRIYYIAQGNIQNIYNNIKWRLIYTNTE